MDSKEFKDTCNIVVQPVDKNDASLIKFLKDVEEAAIKVFEDGNKVENFYKRYRQRICYDVNRQLFKANYKYLIEKPDLLNIQKQFDYIAFLRSNTAYDHYDLDDWENNFRQLENRCREAIKQSSNSSATVTGKQDKKKLTLSYKWQGDVENDLPELYQLLSNHISNDVTLERFKAIFTGNDVSTIVPVKWHDNNASEVLYFILQLAESKNIDEGERLNYERLKACIVQPNGQKFSANFKELKQKIDIYLSQPKRQSIDEIVKRF